MKKYIIVLLAASLVSLSAFAQGTVNFFNAAGSLVRDGSAGNVGVAAGAFSIALYWGVQGAAEGSLVAIGVSNVDPNYSTVSGPVAGRFNGGTLTTGSATAPSGTATFQVRAWLTSDGATYEIASAKPGALFGKSVTFDVLTGGGVNPASNLNPPGFTVNISPVPEPATYALLGLGALGFALRRRK